MMGDDKVQGLQDSSMEKDACYAWRPEFDLSNPHRRGGPILRSCPLMATLKDVAAYDFNPSTQSR